MNTAVNAAAAAIASLTGDQMRALDFICLFDHSGSMSQPSQRMHGKTKWHELQEDAYALSSQVAQYDSDGITVIAFSNNITVEDGVTAEKVADLFKRVSPRGSTNLAGAIEAVIQKRASGDKNAVALIWTDGIPDDKKAVYDALDNAGKKWGRPGIGFCFIQVGDDPDARAFLDTLDKNLTTDVVAVVSAQESQGLTVEQLSWLAQNR